MNHEDNRVKSTRMRQQRRERENRLTRKIVWVIVSIIACILLIIGLAIFDNVQNNLQPYNKQDTTKVEVTVAPGSTLKSLAQQLEDMKIIRSATLFNFYLKTKDVGSLQAGHYVMTPAMTFDDILTVIKEGGSTEHAVLATVLVREGDQIDMIATTVEKTTPFKKDAFLEAVKDDIFIKELVTKYPDLLTSMSQQTDLKYKLEGYLFPATYDYREGDTVKGLIERMVHKMNSVMTSYYETIKTSGKTVHDVLTIASLAEKEGVKTEDRKKIVSVFDNRLKANMPLQSDISVLYALEEHKELVTYKDLEIASPYNLYKNIGYGPGPFNSPSEDAINATLHPDKTDYYYFVADTSTGIVYYAKTYEEHLVLVEKYVNNK